MRSAPLPSSLLWRTFFLLVALLIAVVAAWFQIFLTAEAEPRAQQTSRQIAVIVNLTRTALVSARPESRGQVLRELSDAERIQVHPAEATDQLTPATVLEGAGRVRSLVRAQLGERTRFAGSVNGDVGYWVSFFIEDDEFWLRLSRERVNYDYPQRLFIWGALATAAALLAAWFIAGRLSRPLKRLAASARAVGRGERPPPLEAEGADEVQQVSNAFNHMATQLAQQEADRALVLAGISHDLRTPLARLRLEAEMTKDDVARTGMVSDIEQIDGIIGQFMDFARSDTDEARRSIDLTAQATRLVERYTARSVAVTPGQPFEEARPAYVFARPRGFERALINLIENALRYGKQSAAAPELTVSVVRADDLIGIEIADRGPGIAPTEVERMKRPITQMNEARTNTVGAGLGLAIVERFARTHGGRFDLLPREGGGLRARVMLPEEAQSP